MAEALPPEGTGPTGEGQPTGTTPISLNPDNQPIDSDPAPAPDGSGTGYIPRTPTSDPVSDPVTTPEDPTSTPTTGTRWVIPTGQYLRTRFSNLTLSGTPISSTKDRYLNRDLIAGEPVEIEPAYKYTPVVDFQSAEGSEYNVSYRWQGYFNLAEGIYQFRIRASGGWKVKVNELVVFDNYQGNGTTQQILTVNRQMAAGKALVTVEWHPPITDTYKIGIVAFSFSPVEEITWLSCVDGERRAGDPPEGWTLTQAGCWKPPEDQETPDLGRAGDYIEILPDPAEGIDRTYILQSGQVPASHRLLVYNRSTNMTIAGSFVGPRVVYYTNAGTDDLVQGFSLQPQGVKEIDVKFKVAELDQLEEGLNASTIYAQFEVTNITIEDTPPAAPPLPPEQPGDGGTIPEQPPTEQPPTVTWCDASSGTPVQRVGYPPSDWVVRDDGCYVPSVTTQPVGELKISANETRPIVNTDGTVYATAFTAANVSELNGDLTSFDYEWNFDVLGQGSGIGDTTRSAPKPRWLVTRNDRASILEYGYMTRTVELIARRKGTSDVYRVRKEIRFTQVANALTQLEQAAADEASSQPAAETTTAPATQVIEFDGTITERVDEVAPTTTFTRPRLIPSSDDPFGV